MSIEFTDSNFKETVLESDKVVMVDFWAEWCGPCRIVGPIVDELGSDYPDDAVVGKLNVDENSSILQEYGIRNIPTILFFKGGQVVDKQIGAVAKVVLEKKLKSHF